MAKGNRSFVYFNDKTQDCYFKSSHLKCKEKGIYTR